MFGKYVIKLFAGKKRYQHLFESLGNISDAVRYIGYKHEKKKYFTEGYYLNKIFSEAGPAALTIFDVGANIGDYTHVVDTIAKQYHKAYQVYAFEPSKKTFQVFTRRFADNKQVVAENAGLSDKKGEATLFADRENSDLASVYNLENAYRQFDDRFKETIVLLTLDDYLQEHSISTIDYLKVDAEGHDYHVLKGGQQALNSKKIKAIQFEFGPPNIESRIFFRDFWNLLSPNYDIYRLIDNDIYPITRYMPQLENFLTTNLLAVLKTK